jgi:recombination protein RecT
MTDPTDTGTVAGAVAVRSKYGEVGRRTVAATDWYAVLAPSHANPAALVQLSLAQFDKIKDLRTAAVANPNAWLSAVAEVARLGLMPGDTAYYLPFKSKDEPSGWTITVVVHWTGDVELIHRTGMVETVVVAVVREHDQFAWDPSVMRIPEHHIAANAEGQVGLADRDDRGKLTGVYCYVVFKGGGTSFPTVMTPREVGRARASSRAGDAFWGPPYPGEGPTTEDMWKKTAVHKHAASVPSSPEYLAQTQMHVARALQSDKRPDGVELGGADQPLPVEAAAEPPMALDGGNGDRPAPGTIAGRVDQRRDDRPLNKGQALTELANRFKTLGLAPADGWGRVTAGLLRFLAVESGAAPLGIDRPSDLTAEQARRALAEIDGVMATVGGDVPSAQGVLLRMALDCAVWDGADPAAPDGFIVDPGDDRTGGEE